VTRLEREVARLERELLGPETEGVKMPPIDRELAEEMTEEERARRRADAAAKRRERAIAKNAILEVEEITSARSAPARPPTRARRIGTDIVTTTQTGRR
jgi:hypothetical protein